jgi:hypothetical protein
MVLVSLVLIGAPQLAAQPSSARPDLLGIRRLTARLAVAQRNADPYRPVFMSPLGDEADQLAETPDRRDEALDWVREYAMRQVLFRQQDVSQLRHRLSTLPLAAIHRWLESSQALRTRLTSDSWQETQQWLREFLAAQAIYSDSELNSLRTRLAQLTADELIEVVDHFEATRIERLRRQARTQQMREQALRTNRQLQSAARHVPGSVTRSQSGFPSMYPTQVVRAPRYPTFVQRRGSLSQRVSDYYIYRSIYGNNIWWGWFWP